MRKDHSLRRLVVDETTVYLWNVRHRHGDGDPCRETLTLLRDGVRTRIVFRSGAGRSAGGGYPGHSGGVDDRHGYLNLNEPGVVRALVDEASRRGLLSGGGELDGWELLPAVVVSRAAAATPEVPPGCPPGP
ncbi:hypothetical protein [Streptomyces resistomycificus]|uniref:hypothetical protein n=1 Tax=Streptomyces resistomycificus TaxID=67356 RepID=UPI0007437728|nr:hypothetical protein [Streptomyces resistomycificus]KUN99251.1 hypothetical protein AQJ84_12540 [Streptomyces resistomycificus]